MRLTNLVLVSSDLAEPINISLQEDDQQSQLVTRQILGLDAEEIIAKFYGFSLHSKSKQFDFRPKSRSVAIRAAIQPRFELGEDVSNIRDRLYRSISATRTGLVELLFIADTTVVSRLIGKISKFEAGYFNQLPELQVTVDCDDPMFRAVTPISLDPSELATENPVSVYDSLSTAPHGFTMKVIFNSDADAETLSIQDKGSDFEWRFKLDTNAGFYEGDVVYISSDFGRRDVYVDGSGWDPAQRIADAITPDSTWPVLFPGRNEFHIPQIAKLEFQLFEYYPAYWGV